MQAYQWGAAAALGWRMPGPMPVPEPVPKYNGKEAAKENVVNGGPVQTHARTSSEGSCASAKAVAELRCNGSKGGKSKEVSNMPSEARELVGQVGSMSRTQAGSKYLQRQLLKGPGAAVEVILAEVEEELMFWAFHKSQGIQW